MILLNGGLNILFGLLQVGDWWATKRNLLSGGTEYGPLMKRLIPRLGVDKAFAIKGVVTTLGVSGLLFILGPLIPPHWPATLIAAVFCAVYVWVCIHNLRG